MTDVADAIRELGDEGWRRLRTAARDSLDGVDDPLRGHEDLLNEALTRLLEGRRTWERRIGFEYQVARIMDSIADHWKRRSGRRPEVREADLYASAGEDEPSPLPDAASGERSTEDWRLAAGEARAAAKLFAADPEALQVLECMYLELSRREMRERTRMSEQRLEAVVRRVRRQARAAASDPTPQVTPQVTPHVEQLLGVMEGELSRAEVMTRLGLKDRMHFVRVYLRPALDAGWIERTNPDHPKSSTQKYRRTAEAAATGRFSTLQVTPQVTPQVGQLLGVMEGESSRAELMERLGLRDRMHFARAYLQPALAAGVIERTLPDKPRSRSQRYRRTARGRGI